MLPSSTVLLLLLLESVECLFVSVDWDYFDPDEVGFKELYQLFSLATNQLGQTPVVIDADDLLKQPGGTPLYLSLYKPSLFFSFDRL